MSQRILSKRPEDRLDKNYWKPKVGEGLQGEIIDIYDKLFDEVDTYTGETKKKNNGKVLLIQCSDKSLWETPTHVDLREYIPQLHKGDMVTITLTEEKDVGKHYPKMIYSVAVEE